MAPALGHKAGFDRNFLGPVTSTGDDEEWTMSLIATQTTPLDAGPQRVLSRAGIRVAAWIVRTCFTIEGPFDETAHFSAGDRADLPIHHSASAD